MTVVSELSFFWALELGSGILLRGSVVLAIAGIVTLGMRSASAANRHAVWSISLAALLVLPFLSMTLPSWDVSAPRAVSTVVVPYLVGEASLQRNATLTAVEKTALPTTAVEPSARSVSDARTSEPLSKFRLPSIPALATMALVVWAAGVIFLLARLAVGAGRVHALTRRAMKAPDGTERSKAFPVASRLGVPSSVRVLSSDEASMPMCWGLFHPVVILPATSDRWPSDRKSAVMLHELAHATRCDYFAHVVGELVRAIYWPNPLVWLAVRQSAMERERACDDEALNIGFRSHEYARHLLDVVLSQSVPAAPVGAVAMAGRSNLALRVRNILATGLSRRPMSRAGLVATAIAAVVVTVPIAALELSAEDETTVSLVSRWQLQGPRSVQERILELRSNDARERRYAAWALGELEDDRAVSPLHESLRDSDADVRLVAAWALGEIKHERSVDPLIAALRDDDPRVREVVVLALGEIEHSAAIGPLMDAYERDEALAEPVIWALGEIDTRRADEAREAVFEAVGRRSSENTEVWAGDWLGWEEPRRHRELSTLQRALSDRDPEVRQYAAWETGHLDDERAVESLLDLLRDDEPAVRAMAIWALDETNPSRQRRRVAD